MDINELESVCAVDTYRNYSEAAYEISSSPAVISKHVAKVEKELGIRLFERASKSRPVELTPAGAAVMGYLHSMLGLYRRAQEKALEMSRTRNVTIVVGYSPFIGNYHEPDMLAEFSIQNPDVTIKRRVLGVPELIATVASGTTDAVFLPLMEGSDMYDSEYAALADSDFIIDHILTYKVLTLGLPDGHPLAGCELITRDMFPLLRNDTFLFSCAQRTTHYADRQRGYIHELLGFTAPMKTRFVDYSEPTVALRLVESGAGILPQACIIPRRVGNVNFVPVEGQNVSTSLFYVQRKSTQSPELRRLRRCVHDYASRLAPDGSTLLPQSLR